MIYIDPVEPTDHDQALHDADLSMIGIGGLSSLLDVSATQLPRFFQKSVFELARSIDIGSLHLYDEQVNLLTESAVTALYLQQNRYLRRPYGKM